MARVNPKQYLGIVWESVSSKACQELLWQLTCRSFSMQKSSLALSYLLIKVAKRCSHSVQLLWPSAGFSIG